MIGCVNWCQKGPAAFSSSVQNMFNCSSSSKVQITLVIKQKNNPLPQTTPNNPKTGIIASQIEDNHWPLNKIYFQRDNIEWYGFESTNNVIFISESSSTYGNPAEHCDQAKLRDLLQWVY